MECPKCNEETQSDWRICAFCGVPLSHADGEVDELDDVLLKLQAWVGGARAPGRREPALHGRGITPRDQREPSAEEPRPASERLNCPVCRGTGTVDCGACRNGRDKYGSSCLGCDGTGHQGCRATGCTGGTIPAHWGILQCTICHGTGQQPCQFCVGKGYDFFGETCFHCAGTGIGKCGCCRGSGKVAWPNKDGSPADPRELWET